MSSVPVCRRAVGTRKTTSPKLDSQLPQRGLPLICDGLSPLQNISELLQLLHSVGQLPLHHHQLFLQHLDPLRRQELVGLRAVERLFQVDRWDQEEIKFRGLKRTTVNFQIVPAGGKKTHKQRKRRDPPRLLLLSSSVLMR